MKRALLLIVPCLFVAAPASAQDGRSALAADRCEAGRITSVFVDNHSIFDTRDPALGERFGWAYRLANTLHLRTREEVIRRELLFQPGDCYDPLLLRESERLLRSHGFLARVDIFPIPQADGAYHVVVDTQDEWSTQIDLRIAMEDGPSFEGGRLRELNLLGTGRTLELFYLSREANHEYGAGYRTPQLLGTRWELEMAAGRTRAGTLTSQSIAHPFVGEVGRWAARQAFERHDRYFGYNTRVNDEPLHLLLPVRAKNFEMAAMGRTGRIGDMTLFGAALSFQELHYPGGEEAIRLVEGERWDEDEPAGEEWRAPVLSQMRAIESLRLYLLFGRRGVAWVKRRGLDSMKGDQDIRLGSEFEIALGHSLPGRRHDRSLSGTLSLYHGLETSNLLATGRVRLDGRRDGLAEGGPEWEDIVAGGEAIAYWKPDPGSRHTVVLRLAGVGAWNTRTPFQTTLGGDLGVRGYERDRFPGGRLALASLEERVYFGWPFSRMLDLGGTAFLDVGRVWAGDVPFGTDSGWKASAGVGLRGAFPAGSRTTVRIDLAFPLERGASARDARLVLSIGELIGISSTAREQRMRETRQLRTGGDVFHFP